MSNLRSSIWSRRQLLKQSGLLAAATATSPASAAASMSDAKIPADSVLMTGTDSDNLYTRIGVRPIINARGTFTIISGSQSLPEVKRAMFEASHYYVHLDELMAAVGKEIARQMGAPGAIVTCGCEAAIAVATIASMVGTNPERSQAFPYVNPRNQVIIPKYSRNQYDFAVRMSGPEIIEVETDDEFRSKISDRTAMIYILSGPRAFHEPLSIKTVCAIAKEKNIPVFVDAAAEEPRVPNIHIAAGATFVGYSGGKCMRGPQAAGVLLGPVDLTKAAFWNAAPHHNWGRSLKVGKEEAMGMLAAVQQWYKRDHDAEQAQWLAWDNYIADALKGIPSLTTTVNMPTEDLSNRAPTLSIHWDAAQVGVTGTELVEMLDKGSPRILVTGGQGRRPEMMQSSIGVMPYMMQPGDHKIVAATLSRYLRNPGKHDAPALPTGALVNVTGTWKVEIHYTRGVGQQQFVLSQDGPSVSGDQNGEIYKAKLSGKAVADQLRLTSVMRADGSSIAWTFSGTVSADTWSGDVSIL